MSRDGDDDWFDDLARAVKELDVMLSNVTPVSGTTAVRVGTLYIGGTTARAVGEDWTPPGPTSTPHERIVYLRNVVQHLKESAALAKKLTLEGRQKAYDKAKEIADRGLTIAKRLKDQGDAINDKATQEELDSVKAGLEHAKNAAEDWGLAAVGVASIWLIAAAVGVYVYFKHVR